tara:strand:- start:536 stop:1156 length:621 start_codon:yes stop_codon:yes gene_type:complete
MNIKTAVQLILFTIILGIFYVFYFVYFKKNVSEINKTTSEETIKSEIILTKEDSPKDLNNQNESNIIKNIEYKSTDRSGNDYILRARIGEIDIKNKNIIRLSGVFGKIMLVQKEPININSKFAIYNTENSDTKFYEEVKIQFENNQINSGHFDLFINENIAKIYDNVSFDNNLSKINADIINIDLASGNINVDMYNKSNKVKFLKK